MYTIKKVRGLWRVVSNPSGKIVFSTSSRKSADEWAMQNNTTHVCQAVPVHVHLNKQSGALVWRGRP